MKRSNIFGGIILIFLGVLFLLANIGYLQWNFFLTLFSFWPLFLIAVGLLIIFQNRLWVQLLALLLILVIPLMYYLGIGPLNKLNFVGVNFGTTRNTEQYSLSFNNEPEVDRAELRLDFGVGVINVGSQNSPSRLVNLQAQSFLGEPTVSVNHDGSMAKINIKQKSGSFPFNIGVVRNGEYEDWSLELNKNVIWDLKLDTGAGISRFNLAELKFNKLDLDAGAGDTQIILGDMGVDATVKVDAGVGKLTIVVPDNVGVRADIDSGIGDIDIPRSWQRKGDVYTASNYQQASTNISLRIDQGVGQIKIVHE